MRLGVFGGSFDPVHYGHLLLAELSREALALDEVWFVPAAVPPHKSRTLTAAEHRVAMLELAIGGQPGFVVSRLELERSGVSYTVDTLRELRRTRANDAIFLLVGADMLHDLPQWREPAEVLRLAEIAVVHRHGFPAVSFEPLRDLVDAERLTKFAGNIVPMPTIELASRELRRRIAAGQSIRYQTPRAVEQYIRTHGLYHGQEAGKE